MDAKEIEAYLKAKLAEYEPKVIAWAQKAEQVVQFLHENKTALEIEKLVPGHRAILDAIDRVIPLEKLIIEKLPLVNYAFAAYDIYTALGGTAMSWGGTIAELTASGQLATQQSFDERQGNG